MTNYSYTGMMDRIRRFATSYDIDKSKADKKSQLLSDIENLLSEPISSDNHLNDKRKEIESKNLEIENLNEEIRKANEDFELLHKEFKNYSKGLGSSITDMWDEFHFDFDAKKIIHKTDGKTNSVIEYL